jgi:hypothetical protein
MLNKVILSAPNFSMINCAWVFLPEEALPMRQILIGWYVGKSALNTLSSAPAILIADDLSVFL